MTPSEAAATLTEVAYRGWRFDVSIEDGDYYLQVVNAAGEDAVTGEPLSWKGRKWRLSVHMTKSEIVNTAFLAVMTAEEHEIRETFTYKGEPIYSPHYDVDKLWRLRRTGDSEDLREPAP